MSVNKSFDFVSKQIQDTEGVSFDSVLYKTLDPKVEAVNVMEISKEYNELKQAYTELSARHTAGSHLTREDNRLIDRWNACQDRCDLIVEEIRNNIWYFLREILLVPIGILENPLVHIDVRTDEHFPLMMWMPKVLWAMERHIPVICSSLYGMGDEVFMAALDVYSRILNAICDVRIVPGTNMKSTKNRFAFCVCYDGATDETTLHYVKVQKLVSEMIQRLIDSYPFMQDICYRALTDIYAHKQNISNYRYIENDETLPINGSNERDMTILYQIPIKTHFTTLINYTKYRNYTCRNNLLMFIRPDQFHDGFFRPCPLLTFSMMTDPVFTDYVKKYGSSISKNGWNMDILRIAINITDLIDPSLSNPKQMSDLEYLSNIIGDKYILQLKDTKFSKIQNYLGNTTLDDGVAYPEAEVHETQMKVQQLISRKKSEEEEE